MQVSSLTSFDGVEQAVIKNATTAPETNVFRDAIGKLIAKGFMIILLSLSGSLSLGLLSYANELSYLTVLHFSRRKAPF